MTRGQRRGEPAQDDPAASSGDQTDASNERTGAADTKAAQRAAHAVSDIPRPTAAAVAEAGGVEEAALAAAPPEPDTVMLAPEGCGPTLSVGGASYDVAGLGEVVQRGDKRFDGQVTIPHCYVDHLAQHGFVLPGAVDEEDDE